MIANGARTWRHRLDVVPQDLWVDQCLKRFVHAERIFEKDLLLEAHCDPPEGAYVVYLN